MKKLLLLPIFFICLQCFSQTLPGYTLINGKWEYVYFAIQKGLSIPSDTLSDAAAYSIAVKGSTIYTKLTTGAWIAVGGAGGGGVWGFITGDFNAQSDLISHLGAKYDTTKRFVDTLYVTNDTTIVTLNKGLLHGYKIRGAIPSFNNRSGNILLTQIDVDSALGYAPSNLPNVTNLLQVINAGGAVSIQTGFYGSRPAPGTYGRFYLSVDSIRLDFDNGTSWQPTSTGSGGGGSGTVTAVIKGYGLLPGTITTSGSIVVDSATLAMYFMRRGDSGINYITPLQLSLKEPLITAPNTVNKYWNGYKQFVGLNTDSVFEGTTNKFFTNTRARAAISLTTTGTGAATYDPSTGIFNVPTPGAGASFDSAASQGGGFHTEPYTDARYLKRGDSTGANGFTSKASRQKLIDSLNSVFNSIFKLSTDSVRPSGYTTIANKNKLADSLIAVFNSLIGSYKLGTDSVRLSGYTTVANKNKLADSLTVNFNAIIALYKLKGDSVALGGYTTVAHTNKVADSLRTVFNTLLGGKADTGTRANFYFRGKGQPGDTSYVYGHDTVISVTARRDSLDSHTIINPDSSRTQYVQAHDTVSANALQPKYRSDTARIRQDAQIAGKVINAGASKSISAGTFGSRPAAINCQCYYFSTTDSSWSYDNGTWIPVKGGGGGSGGSITLTTTGHPQDSVTNIAGVLNIPHGYAISVTAFGAVADCNGTSGSGTDNTTPFRNGAAYCAATGMALYIPPTGRFGFRITDSILFKGAHIEIYGYGMSPLNFYQLTDTPWNAASAVYFDNPTKNAFVIEQSTSNKYPIFKMHDFNLMNIYSTRPTAGAGLVVRHNNQQSQVFNMTFQKFYENVDQQSANLITFTHCNFLYGVKYLMHVGNNVSHDFGGIRIDHCAFLSDTVTSPVGSCIGLYVSGSGAIEISSTTFAGQYPTYLSQLTYAIYMDYVEGATSDIDIHDNFFENLQRTPIYAINRSGGTLSNMNIHDNEMKLFNPSSAAYNCIYINGWTDVSIDGLLMSSGGTASHAGIRIDSCTRVTLGPSISNIDYIVADSITNSTGVNHGLSTNSIIGGKALDFEATAGHGQNVYSAGSDTWGARLYVYPTKATGDSSEVYISAKGSGKTAGVSVASADAPANSGVANVGRLWHDGTNVNLSSINNGAGQQPLRIGFGTTPTALVFNTDGTITPGATFQGQTWGTGGHLSAYAGTYTTTDYHSRVSDITQQGVAASNYVTGFNAYYNSGWKTLVTGYSGGNNFFNGQHLFFANNTQAAGSLTPAFVGKLDYTGWAVFGGTALSATLGDHTGGSIAISPDSVMINKVGTGTSAMPVLVWNTSSKRVDTVNQAGLSGGATTPTLQQVFNVGGGGKAFLTKNDTASGSGAHSLILDSFTSVTIRGGNAILASTGNTSTITAGTNSILLQGGLALQNSTFAASFTLTFTNAPTYYVDLTTPSSAAVVTLPNAGTNSLSSWRISNLSTSTTNLWTFGGVALLDAAGNTVVSMPIGCAYEIFSDGSVWRIKNISNIRGIPVSGSFSAIGTATTTFTVTTGITEPNTTYRVNVTPTDALGAALFYVTNKTATAFDVVYLSGLTGTVTFDWVVTP